MDVETTISIWANIAGILGVIGALYLLGRKLEKRLDKIDAIERRLERIEEVIRKLGIHPFSLQNKPEPRLKNGTRTS